MGLPPEEIAPAWWKGSGLLFGVCLMATGIALSRITLIAVGFGLLLFAAGAPHYRHLVRFRILFASGFLAPFGISVGLLDAGFLRDRPESALTFVGITCQLVVFAVAFRTLGVYVHRLTGTSLSEWLAASPKNIMLTPIGAVAKVEVGSPRLKVGPNLNATLEERLNEVARELEHVYAEISATEERLRGGLRDVREELNGRVRNLV
jgi:hypothetical protein